MNNIIYVHAADYDETSLSSCVTMGMATALSVYESRHIRPETSSNFSIGIFAAWFWLLNCCCYLVVVAVIPYTMPLELNHAKWIHLTWLFVNAARCRSYYKTIRSFHHHIFFFILIFLLLLISFVSFEWNGNRWTQIGWKCFGLAYRE